MVSQNVVLRPVVSGKFNGGRQKGFPDQVSLGDIALYNGFDNTVGLYSYSTVRDFLRGLMCVEAEEN